jgi:hypothetical protein
LARDGKSGEDKGPSRQRQAAVGWVLGDRLFVDQPLHPIAFEKCLPAIETSPRDAEVSAGFYRTAKLFRVLENAQFALNVAFFLVH